MQNLLSVFRLYDGVGSQPIRFRYLLFLHLRHTVNPSFINKVVSLMAVLCVLLLIQIFERVSGAVPLFNTGADQRGPSADYVGFVGDPNGRGPASLVISCLLTLVLCVWSALHLNVPSQSDMRVYRLLVNARWIIIGMYAPELVVFTAWRQWSSAKILGKLVHDFKDWIRSLRPRMNGL